MAKAYELLVLDRLEMVKQLCRWIKIRNNAKDLARLQIAEIGYRHIRIWRKYDLGPKKLVEKVSLYLKQSVRISARGRVWQAD